MIFRVDIKGIHDDWEQLFVHDVFWLVVEVEQLVLQEDRESEHHVILLLDAV